MLELLDQYSGRLNLKRKRYEGEASLPSSAKRPDLCLLVRDALLFKGENKTDEGDLAVAELKRKMQHWNQSFPGQVILSCHKVGANVKMLSVTNTALKPCLVR